MVKEMIQLWKKSTGWDKNDSLQKKVLAGFGISASFMVAFSWSWLLVPFAILTIAFAGAALSIGANVNE